MVKKYTPEQHIARDRFAAEMLRYFAEDHKLGNRFFEFGGDINDPHYRSTQAQVAIAAYNMADVMMRVRDADLGA